MQYWTVFLLIIVLHLFSVLQIQGQEAELELILDCSGSMEDQLEGRKKIDIAKESLLAMIDGIPDGTHVGLRAYGHRYSAHVVGGKEKSCKDTELLFPIAPIQKQAMKDRVKTLKCFGYTPIAYSLETAAKDFQRGDVSRTIILVSDGEETCGGNPVAVISKLNTTGFKLATYVIGFAVDDVTRTQLDRIAKAGNGKYYDVRKASELLSGLQEAVTEALPEFAAKDIFHMSCWYQGWGMEIVDQQGDLLRAKGGDGKIYSIPKYLCFSPQKFDLRSLKIGSEVLAATYLVNHKPTELNAGTVLESKKNQVRVSLLGKNSEMWVPAEYIYVWPRFDAGKHLKLKVIKAPAHYNNGQEAFQMELDEMNLQCYYTLQTQMPVGMTFRVVGGAKEISRIGILCGGYGIAQAELYIGATDEKGFAWKPVGQLDIPNISNWIFFKFPKMKAEWLHLRILRLYTNQGITIQRVRIYEEPTPICLPVAKIDSPVLPVGEAGELEKKAQVILVAEGEGRFRQLKLLVKKGDKAIAIAADGKKITVPISQAYTPEPVDMATLNLGDDVLMDETMESPTRYGWYVTATVTEMSGAEIQVQFGATVYRCRPDQVLKVPTPTPSSSETEK